MNISRQAAEYCDDDRRLGLLRCRQRLLELRPAGVVILAALGLGEGLDDLEAFLVRKAGDCGLLCLKAKAGSLLLASRHADMGNCGFMAASPVTNSATNVEFIGETIGAAIKSYKASSEYSGNKASTKKVYGEKLDQIEQRIGTVRLARSRY